MKKIRSLVIFLFCFLFMSQPVFAAYGKWYDLGGGWRMRMDRGLEDTKPHVHVYSGKKKVATENLDGTSSHGSSLDDLPDSVKKRVKEHPEYKKKKRTVRSRTRLIMYHIDEIRDAIELGLEVVVIGGVAISIFVILEWAAKLGLMFLLV